MGPSRISRPDVHHSQRGPADALPGNRPGLSRPDQGLEGSGPAGGHAGDLGRRIRPDPHERATWKVSGTGPPSVRLYHVAGRRRHQAGNHRREDGRVGVRDRGRPHPPCTICTRPSCICWDWTTPAWSTSSRDANSASRTWAATWWTSCWRSPPRQHPNEDGKHGKGDWNVALS